MSCVCVCTNAAVSSIYDWGGLGCKLDSYDASQESDTGHLNCIYVAVDEKINLIGNLLGGEVLRVSFPPVLLRECWYPQNLLL